MTLPRTLVGVMLFVVREDKFIEQLGLIELEPEVPWPKRGRRETRKWAGSYIR
jgi:hypothetical protein